VGSAWIVVPQARMPGANVVIEEALHAPPALARSLITTDVGMAGVSGLLVSEPRTEMDCSPFGVTVQVQQETSSSAGSNVYTFTQMFPLEAPLLVTLITESPDIQVRGVADLKSV
jgi:hypothetical protein